MFYSPLDQMRNQKGVLVVLVMWHTCCCADQCAYNDGASRHASALLQVKNTRQPASFASTSADFQRWKTARVEEVAPVPVPQRELPPCELSNATNACLPRFLVIGNQKSGTSTLYQVLKTHPQVLPANIKELLFFNGNLGHARCDPPDAAPTPEGFAAYLRHFPATRMGDDRLTGEFSASYLNCWCCPAAFERLMPRVRLVVQVRDPMERAASRWREQHEWAHAIPTYGSFEEYVERELPALQDCLKEAGAQLEKRVNCASLQTVLGVSLYDSALKLWHQHFQPADILVTYLEQLAEAPQAVFAAIHAHLGLRNYTYEPAVLHAHYNTKKKYGWGEEALLQSDESIMQRLYEFYRPQMVELKLMADAGLISELPAAWVARWHL